MKGGYPHLASRVFGSTLLIERSKLDVILSALSTQLRIAAPVVMPMDDGEDDEDEEDEAVDQYMIDSGIAVVNIFGSLVRRSTGMDAASGLTSYASIETAITDAATDPAVRGILLNVDSCGGEAGGCFDLASLIYQVRGIKPVWAIADQQAYSAGFALASSAERLYLTQTSGVGSVGVIMLHLDQSAYDEKQGLRYTTIFSGARKNDWNPHEKLSEQALTEGQSEVDRLMGIFVSTVARNRGMTPQSVVDTQAGLFYGEQAVAAKFADGVATKQQVLSEFAARVKQEGRSLRDVLNGRAAAHSLLPPAAATVAKSPEEIETMENTTGQPTASPAANTTAAAAPQPAAQPTATAQQQPSVSRADIDEIKALCTLANQSPKMALDFISAGLSPAQVRSELLKNMAAAESSVGEINGNTQTHFSTESKGANGFSLTALAKKRADSRQRRAF